MFRVGVGVLVAGVLGLALVDRDTDAALEPRSGECIAAAGVGRAAVAVLNPDPAPVLACAERTAAYRIAVRLDGAQSSCPSEVYAVRREGGPDPRPGRTLCLTYNVIAGDCFVETPTQAGRFDCAEGPRPAAIRILQVLEGVADTERCREAGRPDLAAVSVPEPATTFCFTPFAGGRSGPRVLDA